MGSPGRASAGRDASTEGRARSSMVSSRGSSAPTTQAPSRVMPTGTTSNRSRSRLASTLPAETHEIACSPLRPPNTTATRTRPAMVREGSDPRLRPRGESGKTPRRVRQNTTASPAVKPPRDERPSHRGGTRTHRVERPTHHGETPDSPRRNARLTTAKRPTHHGETPDSPWRNARLTVAKRPTHRGEMPDSPSAKRDSRSRISGRPIRSVKPSNVGRSGSAAAGTPSARSVARNRGCPRSPPAACRSGTAPARTPARRSGPAASGGAAALGPVEHQRRHVAELGGHARDVVLAGRRLDEQDVRARVGIGPRPLQRGGEPLDGGRVGAGDEQEVGRAGPRRRRGSSPPSPRPGSPPCRSCGRTSWASPGPPGGCPATPACS